MLVFFGFLVSVLLRRGLLLLFLVALTECGLCVLSFFFNGLLKLADERYYVYPPLL